MLAGSIKVTSDFTLRAIFRRVDSNEGAARVGA